jgi:uncharacterized protein
MERVLRYDRGEVQGRRTTPQGYLRVDGVATKSGVFTYLLPDGTTRREYRPPAEVKADRCLRTLEGCPLTLEHPTELLNPENTKALAVGFTGYGVRYDEATGLVYVPDITITDRAAIGSVERGETPELSCGYLVTIVPTPGTSPEGEPFDVVQTDIEHNHLALTASARAGREACLHLDAAEQVEEPPAPRSPQENRTMLITLNGAQIEVPDAAGAVIQAKLREDATAIQTLTGERDAARSTATTEQTRADGLQGQLDQAKVDLKSRTDTAGQLPALVQARLKLEREASAVLPAETKLDSLTDRQVQEAVIKVADPEAKLDGQADAYVIGRYEGALLSLTRHDSTGDVNAATRPAGGGIPVINADSDPGAAARAAMIKRHQEAAK